LAGGACGLVSEVFWMTPLRIVQGLGAGLVVSVGMVRIWQSFPAHRERAMAFYGLAVYLPMIAGAIVGGLLTAWLSWRLIFLMLWPLGALAAIAAWRCLPRDGRSPAPLPLDLVGLGLHVTWIAALNVALDMGQYWGWATSPHFAAWFLVLL